MPIAGRSKYHSRYVSLLFRLLISTIPMLRSNLGSINTTHER